MFFFNLNLEGIVQNLYGYIYSVLRLAVDSYLN